MRFFILFSCLYVYGILKDTLETYMTCSFFASFFSFIDLSFVLFCVDQWIAFICTSLLWRIEHGLCEFVGWCFVAKVHRLK